MPLFFPRSATPLIVTILQRIPQWMAQCNTSLSLSPSHPLSLPLTLCAARRFDCTGKRIAYLDANVLSDDVLYDDKGNKIWTSSGEFCSVFF